MPKLKKEQQEIINHNDGSILVTASAGSGKTFVMIERLIRLVTERKAKITEILATTFTESSADDMKQKLREALYKKIESGEDDGYLSEQLMGVYSADISTLHSFCSKIIRTYFFALNLSPDYQIADESKANILKEQALSKTFREFYKQKESWFYDLTDKLSTSRSDRSLRECILEVHSYTGNLVSREEYFDSVLQLFTKEVFDNYFNEVEKNVKDLYAEHLRKALELQNIISKENDPRFQVFIDTLVADLTYLSNNDLYGLKRFIGYKLDMPRNKCCDTIKDVKPDLYAVRDWLVEIIKKNYQALTDYENDLEMFLKSKEIVNGLITITKSFTEIYNGLKLEENLLDFNDLEHYTLQILKDEGVKKDVKNKYKYIFVDEYQDINDVQEAIINSISSDNVFMVGDAKQSIYGFRGCRPEIFIDKIANAEKNNLKVQSLNYNFRCAKNVVDMVNEIFSYSMTEKVYGENYSQKSKLILGGVYPEDKQGKAFIHVLNDKEEKQAKKTKEDGEKEENKGEKPRIYNILEEINKDFSKEEKAICPLIEDIIRGELGKTYYDFKASDAEEKDKIIKFSDIVILTRGMKDENIKSIVSGLISSGIPISSNVEQNICDYPEIQVFINLLRLIDCFKQDVPLLVCLKSPIGNLTEEELAQMVIFYNDCVERETAKEKEQGVVEDDPKNSKIINNGFYGIYQLCRDSIGGGLQRKLVKFDEKIKSLRFLADFVGAKGVIKNVVNEFGFINYLLCEINGKSKLNRLHRFIDLCEENGKSLGISEMLYKIDHSEKAFLISDQVEENCVRVMTIHSSKGLEFPVVICCGLNKKFNSSDDYANVIIDRDLGIIPKNYNSATRTITESISRLLYKQTAEKRRVKEELRLFYVALTRAKYSLHLVYNENDKENDEEFSGAKRFIDYIPSSIPRIPYKPNDDKKSNEEKQTKKVLIGKGDEILINEMRENFEKVYPCMADTLLPLKSHVTALLTEKEQEPLEFSVESLTVKSDAETGTNAHLILQNLDFSRKDQLEKQVSEMVSNGILTQEQVNKVELNRLQNTLKNEIFEWGETVEIYKEKGFIVNVPAKEVFETESNLSVLIQGIIDLLVIDNGVALIIDYKYSKLTKESLKIKYKKQLDLYAYAVEKVLKIPVKQKVLVNILSGEVVKI